MDWVECELDVKFIERMKLMAKSVPVCKCDERFMSVEGPLSIVELASYIHSSAPYNINAYALSNQKEALDGKDFIKIFWDMKHFTKEYKDPKEIFAHVLNPIKIRAGSKNNLCYGTYRSKRCHIEVDGLYDPFGNVKINEIVAVHGSMIIAKIDKATEEEILLHQAADEELVKIYRQLGLNIDYRRDLDNRFDWVQKAHEKYRL